MTSSDIYAAQIDAALRDARVARDAAFRAAANAYAAASDGDS